MRSGEPTPPGRRGVSLVVSIAISITLSADTAAQTPPVCANGVIESGETCDDGNFVNGDGCTTSCVIEQSCYDAGNTFSFFLWSDSYGSAGETGVRRLFDDVVNRTRYPNRLIPRFWIAAGDIPYMELSLDKLDRLNDRLSNHATGQRYPFVCQASNGRFPYFNALGNHDVDGYLDTTPESQYDYWKTVVGPTLPSTLVGISNFQQGPVSPDGHDAMTNYSFDYKNAHFIVINQYFEDPNHPTANPVACIRPSLMNWIDADLAQSSKPVKFVFGHEAAWSNCSSLGGYGGAFCPASHVDNQTPARRPRPWSTLGDWNEPFGRHWGSSLEEAACPAGSRNAFWQMIANRGAVAHFSGHNHTYSGRLVEGNGTRHNEVPLYTKTGQVFSLEDGVWEVGTGQVHTSSGSAYVLVTVRDGLVTFEAWDQKSTEAFALVEQWSVWATPNSPPDLAPITDVSGPEDTAITFTASATDSDEPVNTLAFSLVTAPAGATIDPATGAFSWTAGESKGPGMYPVTVRVTDDGVPPAWSDATLTITVTEVNAAPALVPIGNQASAEHSPITFTASATDGDLPANVLTYSLVEAPVGAAIDPVTGVFSWTPGESDGPGSHPVTVRVTDDAVPSAVAETTLTISVAEANTPPALTPLGNQSGAELNAIMFTASASDSDPVASTLSFSLVTAPAGAAIDPATGAFSWTPGESDGPGSYPVTIRVTDDAVPPAWSEATLTITVTEANTAPALAPIGNQAGAEHSPVTFTASATDGDLPANVLMFSVVGAPAGATINPLTGVFNWTPGESDGSGSYPVTVRVTDDAVPPASSDATLMITVSEMNATPTLAPLGTQSGMEQTAITFMALATDSDEPPNALTFSVVNAPAGVAIDPATGLFSWTPGEGDGPGSYPVTVRVTDDALPPATADATLTITVTEANAAPALGPIGSLSGAEHTAITFTASAIDVDLPANVLTFSLVSAPEGATLDSATRAFSWTTGESAGPGIHQVTVRVTDDAVPPAEAEATFTITVTEVNTAPALAPMGNQSGAEHSPITFTASSTDGDLPANVLAYSLVTAPAGATIDAVTGAFSWTPGESDGSNSYPVTVRVTDDGVPPAVAEASFTIMVTEANVAPALAPPGNQAGAEHSPVTFTASASDGDEPPNAVTYSLVTAPAGATIDPVTGAFSWTPGESAGPGSYAVTVRATDDGVPPASSEVALTITVTEVNAAPALAPIGNRSVAEETAVTLTAVATDGDQPANTLTFSLASAPASAAIDPVTGVFSWTPLESAESASHPVTVRVTDDAMPPAVAEATFTITVTEANAAPALAPIGDRAGAEHSAITFLASATDGDLPANVLTYSLVAAPAGATIDPATGAFSWTPGESDGPGAHPVTVRVTDDAVPPASADATLTITVTEVNTSPALAPIGNQSGAEQTAITVAASASDGDLPANVLTYSLVEAPAGATLDPATGAFSWTPGESDGSGTFAVTVRVTDDAMPPAVAEATFAITVIETNAAPVLAAIGEQAAAEQTTITFTAVATDGDEPANGLTFSLVTAPAGATIDPVTGAFSWTPGENDGPGSHPVTVRVIDDAVPPSAAETTLTITVTEANMAPALASVGDQSGAEHSPITFMTSATDGDVPANTLTFSLASAPAGATIDPVTGAFSWTPGESAGPGSYPVTVRVTDDGGPPASSEATLTITVTEVNAAPALAAVGNQSGAEHSAIAFTASGTDSDQPANVLTYSLVDAPAGATIDPVTGAFSWTPGESDGSSSQSVTVRVTDDAGPPAAAETTLTITVTEANAAPALAPLGNRTGAEHSPVTFTASATDGDLPANVLTYSLVSAPAGATIDPVTGAFSWTPGESDGPGSYPVTVRVTDDGVSPVSADATFTITVTEVNAAPTLAPLGNQSGAEQTAVTITASATDGDLPVNVLTYSLAGAPAGAAIDPVTGAFSWTPGESDGSGTFAVTVRVTDDAVPPAVAESAFTIAVAETNAAPTLTPIGEQSGAEHSPVTFTAGATDSDEPANALTFSLVSAPAGATIDPATGAFSWTPGESEGPGTYPVTVRVIDDAVPPGSSDATLTMTVAEVNAAPTLAPLGNQSGAEHSPITFMASATDGDAPANALTFSLVSAPVGAAIDPVTGVFSWTPGESDGPGSHPVTVRVTDDAVPPAVAEATLTVTVAEANTAPTLAPLGNQSAAEQTAITFTASASDSDPSANTLTFSLVTAPAGAAIDPVSGVFSWTPGESDGPGSYPVTVQVTDDGLPPGVAEATLTIAVTEVNVAPVLAPIGNQSVAEETAITFTASSTDGDLPANVLTYSLVDAPAGATLDSVTGAFSWSPGESEGPGTYPVTMRVTDDAVPPASSDATLTLTVTEVNAAPALAPIGDQSGTEHSAIAFTAPATDSDQPANTLTFSLVSAPAGAAIDPTTGAFSWTPGESDGSSSHPVTVRVSDDAVPPAVAEATFTIAVTEANAAPVLAPIGNQSVAEATVVTFTALATDSDEPANALTFSVMNAPAGAAIDPATGVFSWTPGESDGPGTHQITVRVTDDAAPPAVADATLTITVTEVNAAPALAPMANQSGAEHSPITFTASATDGDLPPDVLTYSLVDAPPGAAIDPATGAFSWVPAESHGPGSYPVTVRVTDDATPPAVAEATLTITVTEANAAPTLAPIGNQSGAELGAITFTASASDSDPSASTLTFSLGAAPVGAAIDPATGAFSWTPGESDGPGTYPVTVRVTDDAVPPASSDATLTITVTEANVAPALAPIGNRSGAEQSAITFTASATDGDLPANVLAFSLVSGPAGATIDTVTGAFSWTPGEADGSGTFAVTVRVTDDGSPNALDQETIMLTVDEANASPELSPISNASGAELTAITFTASASDSDVPANTLTYSLSSAPAGASIHPSTGAFTWTPSEVEGPGSHAVTVRATDSGTPEAFAERSLTITVSEANQPPVLSPIPNKSVGVQGLLTFTASASDGDLPAQALSFGLQAAPAGAAIVAATGVFTWTPTSAQVGTHAFSVTVSDNQSPAGTAQQSVSVTVTGGPDLIMSAVSTGTTAIAPGSNLSFSNTVRNQGSAAAGSFTIAFHLSVDAQYGGADDVAFTQTRTRSSLATGASHTAATTLTVPSSTALGLYYVCALADSAGVVSETVETNNGRCTSTTVNVTRSDLIITALTPNAASVRRGMTLSVTDTVRNQGLVSSGSSRVAIRLSANTVYGDADDVVISGTRLLGGISAGGQNTGSRNITVPSSTALGFYYVCGKADSQSAVTETNENNNTLCSATTVQVIP